MDIDFLSGSSFSTDDYNLIKIGKAASEKTDILYLDL
jgi:hypothetical protein